MFSWSMNTVEKIEMFYHVRFKSYGLKADKGIFSNGKLVNLNKVDSKKEVNIQGG